MSTYELLDELEAGELSIRFEGEEPQALLEWAIEEFSPRLAISAAFQADDVALIDMAYKIDPGVRIFTVDTGRLPRETHELIDELRAKYSGLNLHVLEPDPAQVARMVSRKGLDLSSSGSSTGTGRTSSTARSSSGCCAATCARCSR